MADTLGPFEARREAAEHPAVREIHAARQQWTGPVTDERRQADAAMISALILGACEDAGVTLGAYDQRIVEWMSNWEPETCVVIAGLVQRAHEAGKAAKENPDAT